MIKVRSERRLPPNSGFSCYINSCSQFGLRGRAPRGVTGELSPASVYVSLLLVFLAKLEVTKRVLCCCGRRKISKIYIDHTVGSKKTNSGRESYDNFRTFYFLCMERYLFIRVIMP